jgi:hypothetical protein
MNKTIRIFGNRENLKIYDDCIREILKSEDLIILESHQVSELCELYDIESAEYAKTTGVETWSQYCIYRDQYIENRKKNNPLEISDYAILLMNDGYPSRESYLKWFNRMIVDVVETTKLIFVIIFAIRKDFLPDNMNIKYFNQMGTESIQDTIESISKDIKNSKNS